MSAAAAPTVIDEVEFDVEAGKLHEFRRAVGGDPDVVPLTYVVVAGHFRDQAAMVARLGLDITRVVVGSTEWEHHAPIRVGDRLRGARVLADTTTKGHLRFLTLETRFVRADDDVLLVTQRDTLIEVGDR